MRLPVRYYGDSILRKKCVPIEKITDEIRQLIADMIETIDLENGIGLAAPKSANPSDSLSYATTWNRPMVSGRSIPLLASTSTLN